MQEYLCVRDSNQSTTFLHCLNLPSQGLSRLKEEGPLRMREYVRNVLQGLVQDALRAATKGLHEDSLEGDWGAYVHTHSYFTVSLCTSVCELLYFTVSHCTPVCELLCLLRRKVCTKILWKACLRTLRGTQTEFARP